MKKYFVLLVFAIIAINAFSQKANVELNDGRKYKIEIYQEDSTTIHFYMMYNGKKTSSSMDKSKIKSINYNIETKNDSIPQSSLNVNLGFGFGPSYGILGTHTIIGKNNSGLLLGCGFTPHGVFSPAIGGQLAFKWFFSNIGYGTIQEYSYNEEPLKQNRGLFINFGGMINLGRNKRCFLEIGLGLTSQKKTEGNPFENSSFEYFNYTGSLGFGYRFGT